MQVKYWTNFNKRKNSTKQPSGGTEISVSLKNPCSVENPQIEVVGIPDSANYFYIADFGRYYFRSDVIKVTKDITQFSLEVDTMATLLLNLRQARTMLQSPIPEIIIKVFLIHLMIQWALLLRPLMRPDVI